MTAFQPGDRVHLKGHPHTSHTTGTVRSIDALGVHVLWDDGEVVTAQLPLYLEPAGEPMSTTFNSPIAGYNLQVNTNPQGPGLIILGDDGYCAGPAIITATGDAPALALAILEAAGHRAEAPLHDHTSIGTVVADLHSLIATAERKAKEAADREALEGEALDLLNAWRDESGRDRAKSFEDAGGEFKKNWVAVAKCARAARTLLGVTQ